MRSSESQLDLALKAASYAIPAWSVDGMDVVEVTRATQRALASIRAGGGPMFVEFQTYRFRAHSMFDPDLYRPREEIEEWKQRDPIAMFAARLVAADLVGEEEIESMWEFAREETEQAVTVADAAPLESIDTLEDHVLASEEVDS